jgi:hypothetical protein
MIGFEPTTGSVFTTEFTAYSPDENHMISWGDGTYDFGPISTHQYLEDGIYNITIATSLTSFDTSSVCIEVFPESITLTRNNNDEILMGCPVSLLLSGQSLDEVVTVGLFTPNSLSDPYQQPQNYWSHLKPQWRFLDENDNVVSRISITGDEVIDGDITYYTFSANVSYIDDMPSDPDTRLIATIIKEDGVNSRVLDAIDISAVNISATELAITQDGIQPLDSIQWAGVPIHYMVSFVDESMCGVMLHNKEVTSTATVNLSGSCKISENTEETENFVIELKDSDCFSTGGYLFMTSTIPTSALESFTSVIDKGICDDGTIVKNRTILQNAKIIVTITDFEDPISSGNIYNITGESAPFNVYPFEDYSNYVLKNSEKDFYEDAIYKYAPETMKNTPIFDTYLRSVYGKADYMQAIYKKVANFINKADSDICDVGHLSGLCEKYGIPVTDFSVILPEEVKEVMDLYSVNLDNIFGHQCGCNMNFLVNENETVKCTLCKQNKTSNLGAYINDNDFVTYGDAIVLKPCDNNKFFEVAYVPDLGISTGMTLKELKTEWDFLVDRPNTVMYKWLVSANGNYINGMIDRDSINNFIDYPSESEWDDIITEKWNFILTKALRG